MNLIENVTIDKSVTINSATSGSMFVLNGTMTIQAVANKEIRVIGGDITTLNFTSGTASDSTACKFYLVDSQVDNNINANVYGLSLNVLYCEIPNVYVDLKFGNIIGSELTILDLMSGSGVAKNDTTYIVANKFNYQCVIYNQDHNYFIANNYFNVSSNLTQLYIDYIKPNNSGWNNILNNTFVKDNNSYNSYGNNLYFTNRDYSNLNVYNNYFRHGNNSQSNRIYNCHIGYSSLNTSYQPKVQYNVFACPNWVSNGGVYWNGSLNSTNYNNYLVSTSGNTYNSADGRVTAGSGINNGNPSIQYYDINMTRNDMGTYGGPFTWQNYHDTTANGRARVFDLDMPFEIWMGQSPTIKANAVHKK